MIYKSKQALQHPDHVIDRQNDIAYSELLQGAADISHWVSTEWLDSACDPFQYSNNEHIDGVMHS